jgi:hypothetical protein
MANTRKRLKTRKKTTRKTRGGSDKENRKIEEAEAKVEEAEAKVEKAKFDLERMISTGKKLELHAKDNMYTPDQVEKHRRGLHDLEQSIESKQSAAETLLQQRKEELRAAKKRGQAEHESSEKRGSENGSENRRAENRSENGSELRAYKKPVQSEHGSSENRGAEIKPYNRRTNNALKWTRKPNPKFSRNEERAIKMIQSVKDLVTQFNLHIEKGNDAIEKLKVAITDEDKQSLKQTLIEAFESATSFYSQIAEADTSKNDLSMSLNVLSDPDTRKAKLEVLYRKVLELKGIRNKRLIEDEVGLLIDPFTKIELKNKKKPKNSDSNNLSRMLTSQYDKGLNSREKTIKNNMERAENTKYTVGFPLHTTQSGFLDLTGRRKHMISQENKKLNGLRSELTELHTQSAANRDKANNNRTTYRKNLQTRRKEPSP